MRDNHPENDQLIAKCRTSGKFGLQKVENVPLPKSVPSKILLILNN